MGYSHYTFFRVMHEDGNTIGETHVKGQARFVGEDDIGLAHRLAIWTGRGGAYDIGAVDLPNVKDSRGVTTYGLQREVPIGADTREFITDSTAHIEGMPGFGTQAALARKQRVTGLNMIEMKVSNVVVLMEWHIIQNECSAIE